MRFDDVINRRHVIGAISAAALLGLVLGLAGWGGYQLASTDVRHAEAGMRSLRAQVEHLTGAMESLPAQVDRIGDAQAKLDRFIAQTIPELQRAAAQGAKDIEAAAERSRQDLHGKLTQFTTTVAQLEVVQREILGFETKVCIEKNQGGALVVPCRESEPKRRAVR